jgi:hypothetical protein
MDTPIPVAPCPKKTGLFSAFQEISPRQKEFLDSLVRHLYLNKFTQNVFFTM